MGVYIVPTFHPGGVGGGGYSGFQVTGKIKTKKSLGPSIIPPKNPLTKNQPPAGACGSCAPDPKTSHAEFPSLKSYQALNDITQQIKTIERNSHIYAGGTRIFRFLLGVRARRLETRELHGTLMNAVTPISLVTPTLSHVFRCDL